MNRDSDILVGMYIGSTNISVVVAECEDGSDEAQIIGIGQAPSRGVRKGVITNLEQAIESVTLAVEDAQNMVGFQINSATVAFGGRDCEFIHLNGIVSLGKTPREITEEDIEKAIETAQSQLPVITNKVLLSVIPVKYSIDGNFGIDDPLGMTGLCLEVDVQAILAPISIVQNIINCVERAGISVQGLIIKPLISALGSLTDTEKESTTLSLAIGGGLTGLAIFYEGKPVKLAVIPIGGDLIDADIHHITHKIPPFIAENIKKDISVDPRQEHTQEISIDYMGEQFIYHEDFLFDIIATRLEDLLLNHVQPHLYDETILALTNGNIANAAVISGGVGLTEGIDILASGCLGLPVRRGNPIKASQMPPGKNDCRYSMLAGLVTYIMEKDSNSFRYIDQQFKGITSFKKNKTPPKISITEQISDFFKNIF